MKKCNTKHKTNSERLCEINPLSFVGLVPSIVDDISQLKQESAHYAWWSHFQQWIALIKRKIAVEARPSLEINRQRQNRSHLRSSPTGPALHWAGGSRPRSWSSWKWKIKNSIIQLLNKRKWKLQNDLFVNWLGCTIGFPFVLVTVSFSKCLNDFHWMHDASMGLSRFHQFRRNYAKWTGE